MKNHVDYEFLSLTYCDFSKERKTLSVASEYFGGGFPKLIMVKSHHTGKDIWFRTAKPGDKWFDEDQWDGEQMVYVPETFVKNVEKLVVYHAY